jgi:hypothetical protein
VSSAATFTGTTATTATVTIDGPLAERFVRLAHAIGTSEHGLLTKAIEAWIRGGEIASKFWLSADEAADYCAFRAPDYDNPMKAFYSWIERKAVPRGYAGTSLRFRRADLDRAMTGEA